MRRFCLLTFGVCLAAWSLSASAQVITNPFPMGTDRNEVQQETKPKAPDLSVQYVFPEDSKIDLKTLSARVEKFKKLTIPDPADDDVIRLHRARLSAALLYKATIDDKLSNGTDDVMQLIAISNLAYERIADAGMELVQTESDRIELLTLVRDSNAAAVQMFDKRVSRGIGNMLELRKMLCDLLDAELKLALAKKAYRKSPKQPTQR